MKAKRIINISLIILLSLTVIILGALLIYINATISPIKNMDVRLQSKTNYSQFYNDNYELIDNTHKITHRRISINEIPTITKNAFISTEDKNFYKHNGLNYKRIIKASINNILSGELKEGASTITQQLVKNKYLSNEKTFKRKIKEAYIARKLEKNETKDKILEEYLNTIYFGNGAYGIGDACQIFFGKDVSELNLVESATLAGCIKSPSNYSPINNYEKSNYRKNIVLNEMLKDKYITQEEYNQAFALKIDLSQGDINYCRSNMDLYTQYVLDEASDILNTNPNNILYGNYKIYTYQDDEIQKILDKKINNENYYHINEKGNIADSLSFIINNQTGGVSAVSGKSDYNLVNFKRQPGSLIKPIFTFAPAIEEGLINSKTQILDEKIDYNGYKPNNVGNKFYGYVSVEEAVAKSLNIPTIKITEKLGIEKCKDYASRCSIEFNKTKDIGYALSLGGMTDGVTLKSMTDAYSVFTNDGNYRKSKFIKKITDSNNMTIYKDLMSYNSVYGQDTMCLMTDIMNYAVHNGTSKKLAKLDFDVAGKTGTVSVPGTNYNTDAYSLAYTSDHTMSVWLGNYSMKNEYNLAGSNNGGTYATEIIRDTFDEIYNKKSPTDFTIPDSVIMLQIDKKTLDENHLVALGENIPERYKINSLFSKRYIPKISSNKFNAITPFTIKINAYKNSCEISFDTNDYIDYKLYRENNNKIELIKTIKNHNGLFSYIDNDIQFNKKYSYYVIASSNYSESTYTTNKEYVLIEKEYNELLQNPTTENISWLFD